MLQLNPREYFTIARGLEDHTDSTTYYVRAVIRNAKTDAVIETVDLVDNGNRRFTYNWQVPADPSGLGFYVLITSTIYTDSGYTAKAEMYGEKFETYLIAERDNPLLHGGPGGPDVSYKKIREIVQAEIAKLPPVQIPEMPNLAFHLQPVLNALSGLRKDIGGVELPAPDFSGVEHRLNLLEGAIKAIEIPEVDLQPILDSIATVRGEFKPNTDQTKQDLEALLTRVKQFFTADMDRITAKVAGIEDKLNQIPYVVLQPQQSTKQPVDEEIDYQALLNHT